ncbi:nipped-B-like protein A [Brachyhypopomus gauderio]|uniref:nipped-B-like protein A n=1 Tax=Brachyhypopomus gauderio TaxID=698409 RepID=UPI004041C3A8
MEHLDPDEEEEVGENAAAVRNKAISALLEGTGGAKLHNHHQAQMDEYDSEGDERTAGVSGRGRKAGESADAVLANMSLSVSALDIVALHCPQYRNRPQLGRVLERTADGYSVRWMAGSFSSAWSEARRKEGRKLVPWVETVRLTDIIYRKITLTTANKLSHKLAQTLRALYASKDRNPS